jgi:hypothetical protein
LQSGAFWFYYRLGFRPMEDRPARLAAAEWARMRSDPGYRTPIPMLRRFTGSDIELRLDDVPDCEPACLSEAVSAWIGDRCAGDRSAAEQSAANAVVRMLGVRGRQRWPRGEQVAFAALALLVAQIDGVGRWPVADKRSLVALMRAKGADEFRFHRLASRHRRFREALALCVARQRASDLA